MSITRSVEINFPTIGELPRMTDYSVVCAIPQMYGQTIISNANLYMVLRMIARESVIMSGTVSNPPAGVASGWLGRITHVTNNLVAQHRISEDTQTYLLTYWMYSPVHKYYEVADYGSKVVMHILNRFVQDAELEFEATN